MAKAVNNNTKHMNWMAMDMIFSRFKTRVCKQFLPLFVLFLLSIGSSCSLLEKVEQSTNAIDENRHAVQLSTKSIAANQAIIQQSNMVISANKELIKGSSQSFVETVEGSNKAIAENHDLIEKTNMAIKANQEIITRNTLAIQENITAVELSSAVIKKNAEVIREATHLMSQLTLSPPMAGIVGLMVLIGIFFIPLLSVLIIWRIKHDVHLLLKAKNTM